MSEVYSTNQAAERLSVSPATIHTWKKRNPERLSEGNHWLKDEKNSLLWTEQGIQALSALKEGNETEPLSEVNEQDIQEPSALERRYLPLLDMLADAIAPKLQRQLDQKVMGKVKDFATNAQPLTAVECVALLTQLGLKPSNPADLLAGQDFQALPQSNQ
jgi:DNA-binding transcriptional MerR regulator